VASGYRAALLRFDAGDALRRLDDALLVVEDGRIAAVGEHAQLAPRFPGLAVRDWRGLTLAPGFVDLHLHYPQVDVVASPADGLLPWLENYTFPQESRFADPLHADAVAASPPRWSGAPRTRSRPTPSSSRRGAGGCAWWRGSA
jgi:guanine deaminase